MILSLLAIVFTYVFYKLYVNSKFWDYRGVPNVKRSLFILFKKKSMVEKTMDLYQQFSDVRYHGVNMFMEPGLVIHDADLIKDITVKHFDHFTDHRTYVAPEVDPVWDKNLFATKGEKWHRLRATLSPSFTSSKLKPIFVLIHECANNLVDYFKNQEEDVLELEMKDICTRFSNDVIATTAFGIKCDSLKNRDNDFYILGKKMTDFSGLGKFRFFFSAISPQLAKLFQVRIIPKREAEYFSNIITETVATRREQEIVRPDMINLMMQAQNEFEKEVKMDKKFEKSVTNGVEEVPASKAKLEITTDDIISQAFIFFLAGFDTVSTSITFLFYELAINPDIQTKLRTEIQKMNGKVTYEDITALKYLDMVVSENLRKWPVSITSERAVTKPFTIEPVRPDEKPLRLEKGTTCLMFLFGLHRDPKYFPDPEKFDPERFSAENKHKIHPYAYIPFGSGPRLCIGSRFALLEIKLITYCLLKEFEIVPTKKTKIPLVLDPNILNPACEGGMWLGLKKISH